MSPSGRFPRGLSPSRLLMAVVIAWIVLLTVIILLDPHGSAG
ncbi:hypothetical protein [Nonomuraea indica]|uniref:Uncharacterized protein n=1 Tax=Nonomuraea indica TaxID=1581193 RepID=A0ABW7ZY62_9ACTN|nr:hypothetical protein [Nonomuraea indica]